MIFLAVLLACLIVIYWGAGKLDRPSADFEQPDGQERVGFRPSRRHF